MLTFLPLLRTAVRTLAALLTLAWIAAPALADRLERHQWRHRVLVAFVPDDAAAQHLIDRVAPARDALAERDLLIERVHGDGREARALRERFGVRADARVFVLIGKDGTQKARQAPDLDIEALIALIDTMPMRQREMRERNTGSG